MLRREPTRVETYADAMEEYKSYLEEKRSTQEGELGGQERKNIILKDQERIQQETRSRIGLIAKWYTQIEV